MKREITETDGRHGLTRTYYHSAQISVASRANEELYRREVEARLISEIAHRAHVAGYRFVGWPEAEWRPVKYVDGEKVPCEMSEARNIVVVMTAETELQ